MKSEQLDPRTLNRNPWNSNSVGPENMAKLKHSITELGFATAVVVRELDGGRLQILGGQHRCQAAIELGLKKIPVLNLGEVDDVRAKKISLVDNHRYGNDDVIALAKIYEDVGGDIEKLTELLPVAVADMEAVMESVNFNLDDFDVEISDDDDEEPGDDDAPAPTRLKTHDIMKFRITMSNAEAIRRLIEKTIKDENLDGADDITNAGDALAFLLLTNDK